MRNSSTSWRLSKFMRDYKTFHQYSIQIQPKWSFFLWNEKRCSKKHSVLLSLENFCMVMQWVLKTVIITFFDDLHHRRRKSSTRHTIIYQMHQLCFHRQIWHSYLERQLLGINSTARGRNDLTYWGFDSKHKQWHLFNWVGIKPFETAHVYVVLYTLHAI